MKKIPYHPRLDGFVLTNAAIHIYLARQQRNHEARVAKEVGYDEAKFAKAVGT
ncbi:MAG: hypothetical protein M3Y27_23995 [Acidobacteriota bacterium]|nr:hypothetical protein [Acidobacteriota bacterium]